MVKRLSVCSVGCYHGLAGTDNIPDGSQQQGGSNRMDAAGYPAPLSLNSGAQDLLSPPPCRWRTVQLLMALE